MPPTTPTDPLPVPITVKGVCRDPGGRVLLCHDEKAGWELPGGRPEPGEPFPQTLRREFREETGIGVEAGALLAAEPLQRAPERWFAALIYLCLVTDPRPPVASTEHTAVAYFTPAELETIPLPGCFRRAIAAAPPPVSLFHLALPAEYAAARASGSYPHSSRGLLFADAGFVHLAYAHQLAGVVERFYADVAAELLVLRLDPLRLGAPVVLEPAPGSGELFPHLYGQLTLEAVVSAEPLAASPCQNGMAP